MVVWARPAYLISCRPAHPAAASLELRAGAVNSPQIDIPVSAQAYEFERNRYSLRYSGALVADMHQILHRGGIYAYPEDNDRPEGKLRLLYECAPLAMIAEQAGGTGTSGKMRIIDIRPENIHQRVPFAVGSRQEIQTYEAAFQK